MLTRSLVESSLHHGGWHRSLSIGRSRLGTGFARSIVNVRDGGLAALDLVTQEAGNVLGKGWAVLRNEVKTSLQDTVVLGPVVDVLGNNNTVLQGRGQEGDGSLGVGKSLLHQVLDNASLSDGVDNGLGNGNKVTLVVVHVRVEVVHLWELLSLAVVVVAAVSVGKEGFQKVQTGGEDGLGHVEQGRSQLLVVPDVREDRLEQARLPHGLDQSGALGNGASDGGFDQVAQNTLELLVVGENVPNIADDARAGKSRKQLAEQVVGSLGELVDLAVVLGQGTLVVQGGDFIQNQQSLTDILLLDQRVGEFGVVDGGWGGRSEGSRGQDGQKSRGGVFHDRRGEVRWIQKTKKGEGCRCLSTCGKWGRSAGGFCRVFQKRIKGYGRLEIL